MVAGLIAEAILFSGFANGLAVGVGVYLASYYIARYLWYRGVGQEWLGKIYSTGIGGYFLVFLFTWMLSFTLQNAGLV